MKAIDNKELVTVAYHYMKAGKPIIILGRTGIGKSMSLKRAAKKAASEKKKEFIDWNAVTYDAKKEVIKNPDKYYVYVDMRMTQLEPSDLRGLPDLSKDGATEWKPNMWTIALSKCEGTLNFEEINLCAPTLQATLYQILLEKTVGEIPLHMGVAVFGTGNLSEDRAGTFELAKPIRTRAGLYELSVPSVEDWTSWAIDNQVDSRIIYFLTKFKDKLFKEEEKHDDIVSPRSWESVSDLIKGETNFDKIQLLSSGQLGEGISLEFAKFLKLWKKIPTPEAILSGKAKIPAELDLKYACLASVTEHYRQSKDKDRTNVAKQFMKLRKSMMHKGSPEFYILALRMFKGINQNVWKDFMGTKEMKAIMEYSEYLK